MGCSYSLLNKQSLPRRDTCVAEQAVPVSLRDKQSLSLRDTCVAEQAVPVSLRDTQYSVPRMLLTKPPQRRLHQLFRFSPFRRPALGQGTPRQRGRITKRDQGSQSVIIGRVFHPALDRGRFIP